MVDTVQSFPRHGYIASEKEMHVPIDPLLAREINYVNRKYTVV